jgi:ABC-type antimicrobial peptide transport system permease subunit
MVLSMVSINLREQFGTALTALLAGTVLLLLMVCANVGGLLLARGAARAKETAVRLALGATRLRIASQFMLESLVVTFLGGAAGAAFVYAAILVLMRWMPQLPLNSVDLRTVSVDVRIGFRVVVFAIACCSITAILSALAPAWRATRDDLYSVLKGTMSDIRHRHLQAVLCSVQIALFLYVKTRDSAETMVDGIRRALQSMDPKIPIYEASTISAEIERSLWRERLVAGLSIGFGAFALLLSAIGLYGALAYYVAQHQQDLGVRLALGASALDIVGIVLRRITPAMIGGLASGLTVYSIAGRSMQTLFFGVGFGNPAFISAAVIILMATAAGASAVPIYRALSLDVASLLKRE